MYFRFYASNEIRSLRSTMDDHNSATSVTCTELVEVSCAELVEVSVFPASRRAGSPKSVKIRQLAE